MKNKKQLTDLIKILSPDALDDVEFTDNDSILTGRILISSPNVDKCFYGGWQIAFQAGVEQNDSMYSEEVDINPWLEKILTPVFKKHGIEDFEIGATESYHVFQQTTPDLTVWNDVLKTIKDNFPTDKIIEYEENW